MLFPDIFLHDILPDVSLVFTGTLSGDKVEMKCSDLGTNANSSDSLQCCCQDCFNAISNSFHSWGKRESKMVCACVLLGGGELAGRRDRKENVISHKYSAIL